MHRGIYLVYIPEHKLLFVHVPKTGGQTVTKYIYECLDIGNQFDNNRQTHMTIESLLSSDVPDDKYLFTKNYSRKLPGPNILAHMKLTEYFDLGYIKEDFDKIIKFTVVRDPYARALSALNFKKVGVNINSLRKYALSKDKKDDKTRHFMRQSDYLIKDGNIAVDYILKTEDLDTELKPFIEDKFGLVSDNFNTINSGKYKVFDLKPDIIKFINDHYHDDFVNFGYTKRDPHA
jgi:hypothetical protein